MKSNTNFARVRAHTHTDVHHSRTHKLHAGLDQPRAKLLLRKGSTLSHRRKVSPAFARIKPGSHTHAGPYSFSRTSEEDEIHPLYYLHRFLSRWCPATVSAMPRCSAADLSSHLSLSLRLYLPDFSRGKKSDEQERRRERGESAEG